MVQKLSKMIESKRKSENFFWIIAVKVKDFLWFACQKIKHILRLLNFYLWLCRWFLVLFFSRQVFFFHPSLLLSPFEEKYLIFNEYEAVSGYFMEYLPKKGDVVIDAGAFHGFFTGILSLLVGGSGKVIAFEPNPGNFNILKKNLSDNKFKNVIFVNKGLSNEDADSLLFLQDGLDSSFLINNPHSEKIKATTVRLDSELPKLGIKKVDFIKMDIEGSEIEAVKGGRKTLENNDLHLAIASYHLLNGEKTCFELEKQLNRYGYKTKTGFEKNLTTYAWKDEKIQEY